MAGNPVSSFLAGFAAVDQLETNRQNRAFQEEQRSRLHTLWERDDQAFERAQLDQFRQDKLVEFDAAVQDFVTNLSPEKSAEYFGDANVQNGRPAGFTKVANEILKQMVQADPEFGEHVAKAFGIDAASGPLVRDPTKPISGVGLIPDELAPGGKGGAFFEVDSINGPQPVTRNRTSANNDQIVIGEVGLRELVGVFGQGVRSNALLVNQQMRRLAGLDEPTGNPLVSSERETTPGAQGEPAPTKGSNDSVQGIEFDKNAEPEVDQAGFDEQQRIRQAADEAGLPLNEFIAQQNRAGNSGIDNEDALGFRIANSTVGGVVEGAKIVGGALSTTGSAVSRSVGLGVDESARRGSAFVDFSLRAADSLNSFFGVETDIADTRVRRLAEEAATKPSLIETPASDDDIDARRSDLVPGKITKDPEAAARAVATVPLATEQGAQAAAGQLLSTSGKRRVPSFQDTYLATIMVKQKMISPEQYNNYLNTGQLNKAAKQNLKVVQSGNFARLVDESGNISAPFQIGPGEGDGAATVQDQQRLLNLLQDSTAGLFDDDPEGQQQFIDAAEGVFTILGFPNTKAGLNARANPDVLNSMARGADFVSNFDEDTTQNLFQGTGDFNLLPGSDLQLPMTAGNVALGFAADQSGIVGQEAANEFLAAYAGDFNATFRLSARELFLNAVEKERTVKARLDAGRNPEHNDHEKYKDKSLAEVRREYVEELITNPVRQ